METTPSPTVIEIDFKTKPVDEAERPFLPQVKPTPPVPFRKRTTFLPVRFFSAKRLPQVVPPGAEADEQTAEADGSPDAAEVQAAEAIGETENETAARSALPPLPEEATAAPVGLTRVEAVEAPDPMLIPKLETTTEMVSTPGLPPTATAAVTPEPPADTPEPTASVPATPEPSAPVSAAPAPQPPPAPKADAGPRSDVPGASVQLTLSCEVAALRLTPSFQLGGVQLRALSDVVSLRFVAPREAENPLAAVVAFQIVHVELDPTSRRLKNLLLKPLDEARDPVTPLPRLQVAEVGLVRGGDGHAPITVTTAAETSTAVQLFGTFNLGSIHFTPVFGIATLRLELASDTVLVRVTPSILPTARDLPPSFDLAEAELDANGRLTGLRLNPGAAVETFSPRP